jgi:hypothetical protein
VAAKSNVPIFAVPAGSSARIPDVSIADVFAPSLVSVGDTVSVSVTIESHAFDGRLVNVELVEGDETLVTKALALRGAEQQQIELTFQASGPGARYLTVRVTKLDEEIVHANNEDVAFVRVDDQRLRVLYIEGSPRWDFRFIKNGIRRDHGLDATVIVEAELKARAAGGEATIPNSIDEWAAYRTVILGDCGVETMTPARLDTLAAAVREKGLGLIVLAGPNHMPHGYEGTSLIDLMPVRARREMAGYDAAAHNAFKMEITPAGALHEAFRLLDEPSRNAALWARMPPFYWCAAVVRPAPGATVLASNPSIEDRFGKLPLVAYHYAGKGKSLFVGTDSTWLWRQNAGDRYFYKFWGQTIRFVARREDNEGQNCWIELRPLRSQPGEPVEIELMAFGPDGKAHLESAQSVAISGPSQPQVVSLAADAAVPGRYTGQIVTTAEGEYRFRFQPRDGESAEAVMRVQYAAEELRRPSIDRTALEMIASHSGGQVVELSELASIPEKLRGEAELIEMHREETIWDNWLTVVLLALFYCVDVAIRRLSGLS